MSEQTPLQELAQITDAVLTRKTQTSDPQELAKLNGMLGKIGEIQLELARRDADRAECAAMQREMRGPDWIRTSLDE